MERFSNGEDLIPTLSELFMIHIMILFTHTKEKMSHGPVYRAQALIYILLPRHLWSRHLWSLTLVGLLLTCD
jgi:hypothetical protein